MPRKSRSAKSATAAPLDDHTRSILEQDPELSPIGRDANGRFARGNAGGPGNPHARHCARMLAMIRNWVDDDKMLVLMQVLYDKAITGDMAALKLLFSYKVGKPGPAPEPDAIERDEWNRFEETAVRYQEIQDLLNSLPSNVANEIVRGTWPVAAGAWADNLGRQLQQAGAAEAAAAGDEGRAAGEEKKPPSGAHGEPNVRNEQLEKYEEFMDQQIFGAPLPNGFAAEVSAARKQPTQSNGTPIPNRKSNAQRAGDDSVPTSPAPRHAPPAATTAPIATRKSRAQARSEAAAQCSPAPRNSPPATGSLPAATSTSPIAIGKSKTPESGKAGRNTRTKQWLEPIASKVLGPKSRRKSRALVCD